MTTCLKLSSGSWLTNMTNGFGGGAARFARDALDGGLVRRSAVPPRHPAAATVARTTSAIRSVIDARQANRRTRSGAGGPHRNHGAAGGGNCRVYRRRIIAD